MTTPMLGCEAHLPLIELVVRGSASPEQERLYDAEVHLCAECERALSAASTHQSNSRELSARLLQDAHHREDLSLNTRRGTQHVPATLPWKAPTTPQSSVLSREIPPGSLPPISSGRPQP